MKKLRFIPIAIHGAADYLVGITLVFSPWIFGFSDVRGASRSVPISLGIAIILYSILTSYDWGLVRIIPFKLHLVLDFMLGIFLSLSPWIFSFSAYKRSAWFPHVVTGLGIVIFVLISRTMASPVKPEPQVPRVMSY